LVLLVSQLQEINPMTSAHTIKHTRSAFPNLVPSPATLLGKRVEAVGPARFGVVAIDCAKASSRWRLADFYGGILIPPTTLIHRAADFDNAVRAIRAGQEQYRLGDLIVALERTGRYHLPLKRVFTDAGFEVRIIDPLATHQYRKPAHGGTKTDDIDLEAIHNAVIHGFGLVSPEIPPTELRLRDWARHRRDLVTKVTRIRCQIREHLHTMMPGFAELFDDLFNRDIGLFIPLHFSGVDAIRQAGLDGLAAAARAGGVRCQRNTLVTILAWAQAAVADAGRGSISQAVLADLIEDFRAKKRQITAAELAMAHELVRTPHLVLLSMPGINVVTAGELAGELGPITAYAGGRAISGRAGLYPSRHQSGPVDRRDGPLVRRGNRRLRAAILRISDTLLRCNDHFAVLGRTWELAGVAKTAIHVRIGGRFCRIAFHMIAGGQPYRHPSGGDRDYVLHKLIKFYIIHNISTSAITGDLQSAAEHLPPAVRAGEAAPLRVEQTRVADKRGAGPRRLTEILTPVLERLLQIAVELNPSGESSRAR